MLNDLRYAARRLRMSPGFTAVVVLTLGLGIGGVTGIFTLVEAVLLRPLDYPDPARIVTVWSWEGRTASRYRISGPDLRDWREQSRSFAHLASYRTGGTEAVVLAGTAENIQVAAVSGSFFDVLGVPPRAGRPFSAEELRTGGAVLVGDALVRRHFGGDARRALDATLEVYGRIFQIIGVLPPGFAVPERTEVWLPVDTVFPAAPSRSAHNYYGIGRLAAGVSLAQAQAELDGITGRLARQYPESNRDKGARLIPLHEVLVSDYQSTLWILLAAVVLVLLVACANIANLLLARGARRAHELAVRAAMGASRGRIARQLLAESLLLAALGGLVGVALATWGLDALLALVPRRLPGTDRVALNGAALAFTAGVSMGVALLIGVLPALQAGRLDVSAALHATGRAVTGGRGRLRAALVVVQLAVCLALLVGAGLLLQSLRRLAEVDPGYRTDHLLVLEANYSGSGEADGRRGLAFFAALARQAAALPGVTAATFTGPMPVESVGSNGTYWIEGQSQAAHQGPARNAIFRAVGPGHFSVLGIPVRAGREVDQRDTFEAPRTIVINESMARAAWPDRSPIGQRIRFGWFKSTEPWMTIVGVVADTKQVALDRPTRQELYVPAAQHPSTGFSLKIIARTTQAPLALADRLRAEARALDPTVPVVLTTAERMVSRTMATPRFRTALLGLFAAVALLLAVIGVGGVMASVVAERRTEIGVRIAVGARPGHILGRFLARALRLTALGLALGGLAALAATRWLQGFLFGVEPTDPWTFAATGLLLTVAALAAAAWPALRAARTSPMTVLRGE